MARRRVISFTSYEDVYKNTINLSASETLDILIDSVDLSVKNIKPKYFYVITPNLSTPLNSTFSNSSTSTVQIEEYFTNTSSSIIEYHIKVTNTTLNPVSFDLSVFRIELI